MSYNFMLAMYNAYYYYLMLKVSNIRTAYFYIADYK